MPTYDQLFNGYYDSNQGTYIAPSRIDWRSTMDAAHPGVFPASMPPQYARDMGQGPFGAMDFAPYNWMGASYDAGLQPPTSRQLVLYPPPHPQASEAARVAMAIGVAPPEFQGGSAPSTGTGRSADTGSPYASGALYQTGRPLGEPLPNSSPYATPTWSPPQQAGPPQARAQEPQQARAQEPQQEQSGWNRFPKNAAYISTDGLVAYDEQGYRLDGIGNRAVGPESDNGAHLFNQGYDTASAGWNQAHGWS